MKKPIMLAGMILMFAAASVSSAGVQQERMKSCNKDAKEKALKGDERKAFMKDCLKGKADAPATDTAAEAASAGKKPAQHEKMKSCNKEAREKALKGDERKAFMKECLKA